MDNQQSVIEWDLSPDYFRKKNFLNFLTAWIVCLVAISAFSYIVITTTPEDSATLYRIIIFGVVVSLVALMVICINALATYKGYSYRIDPDQLTITEGTNMVTYKWSDMDHFTREPLQSYGGHAYVSGYNFQTLAGSLIGSFLKTYNFVISLKGIDKKIIVSTKNKRNSELVGMMLGQYLEGR